MEKWEKDFKWLEIRNKIAESLGRPEVPDLQTTLYLIGIQELGWWEDKKFSKEEKQDLMHIGVCTLLEEDGYYEFKGRDHDGWPHWVEGRNFDKKGIENQEEYLVEKVIKYFEAIYSEKP
jgi:hypothetical protein